MRGRNVLESADGTQEPRGIQWEEGVVLCATQHISIGGLQCYIRLKPLMLRREKGEALARLLKSIVFSALLQNIRLLAAIMFVVKGEDISLLQNHYKIPIAY